MSNQRGSVERKVDLIYGTVSVVCGIAGVAFLILLPSGLMLSEEWDKVIGASLAVFCFAYATNSSGSSNASQGSVRKAAG